VSRSDDEKTFELGQRGLERVRPRRARGDPEPGGSDFLGRNVRRRRTPSGIDERIRGLSGPVGARGG